VKKKNSTDLKQRRKKGNFISFSPVVGFEPAMSAMADQHHSGSWLSHEARGVNGYDAAANGAILPSEDISDMFFPHTLDSNPGHMNAGYYSSSAARAVQAYRPHGECTIFVCLFFFCFLFFAFLSFISVFIFFSPV
jgi:hypothetical protein